MLDDIETDAFVSIDNFNKCFTRYHSAFQNSYFIFHNSYFEFHNSHFVFRISYFIIQITFKNIINMTNSLKNSVQLIGNIGKDIVLSTFDNGNKKASMVIATNDYYTNNKGEKVKQTEWHNLIAWGKTAELMAESIAKGNEVAIHGKLTSRSYTDKEGATKYVTEIIVNDFYKIARSA